MELLLLLISAFCILVGCVGGNPAPPLSAEIYWKHKFPSTQMPNILHDLLHPASDQETKSPGDRLPACIYYMFLWAPGLEHKNSTLDESTIPIEYAAANGNLQDNPGASLFFLEKDLYPGAKMNLHFVVNTPSGTTFLPKKIATVTPFSSDKLPEILNQFAISRKSGKAKVVGQAMFACEQPPMENEEKYCATSLESLVEYGTSKFGKNVDVLTTEILGDKRERTRIRKLQQYVVGTGVRQIHSDNLVPCHSLPYPYAVFYCHSTSAHTAQAYVVPLVGVDGTKIKATAVCHKDTSKWDPRHVVFKVLEVKPGSTPVCHFFTEDNIIWAAKNKNN